MDTLNTFCKGLFFFWDVLSLSIANYWQGRSLSITSSITNKATVNSLQENKINIYWPQLSISNNKQGQNNNINNKTQQHKKNNINNNNNRSLKSVKIKLLFTITKPNMDSYKNNKNTTTILTTTAITKEPQNNWVATSS